MTMDLPADAGEIVLHDHSDVEADRQTLQRVKIAADDLWNHLNIRHHMLRLPAFPASGLNPWGYGLAELPVKSLASLFQPRTPGASLHGLIALTAGGLSRDQAFDDPALLDGEAARLVCHLLSHVNDAHDAWPSEATYTDEASAALEEFGILRSYPVHDEELATALAYFSATGRKLRELQQALMATQELFVQRGIAITD
jgi:hypothetical protein